MPNLVYTGILPTNNLWQNEPQIPTPGSPNSLLQFPFGTQGSSRPYNPYNTPIQWNGTVPSSLDGITIASIVKSSFNYDLKIDYTYSITSGNQNYICGNVPTINLELFRFLTETTGILPFMVFFTNMTSVIQGGSVGSLSYVDPNNPNNVPRFNYTEEISSDSNPDPTVFERSLTVQVNPWNNGNCAATGTYPVGDFSMNVAANITLTISCNTPNELESNFCLTLCTGLANQETCFPSYQEYCLTGTNDNLNIFGSTGCYNFFQDYIQGTGPRSEIDVPLTNACSVKFPLDTALDAFNSASNTVQNICACHLNPQFYSNLQASLTDKFPGSQLIAEPDSCLFPVCVSSPFKSDVTTKVCPVPACVNIASITNNGTVTGNNTINQGITGCANIAAPGSANNPPSGGGGTTPTKSWWDQHWLWVVMGISLLVMLIIVILIIIASESNSKNKKPK